MRLKLLILKLKLYLRKFRIVILFLRIWVYITKFCMRITATLRAMAFWYTEYKYTLVQKTIYSSCWVIWFCGFTYDYHNNIFLFEPFVEAYLANSFIYNVSVYSFKIKNITLFQYVRGLCFVCIWHYIDYAVCLPILRWVVYVLDKKVDYESMGWVYKLEAYLDDRGWMPRHPWSTYRKKQNVRQWDFFMDQHRMENIQNLQKIDTTFDYSTFGLTKLFDYNSRKRDAAPQMTKDGFNRDMRDHNQFLYQEKLFAEGMDIFEAKQKAKEAFQNDKTDYWAEDVDKTRLYPKEVYEPSTMPLKYRRFNALDESLFIRNHHEEHMENEKKYDHTSDEFLDNLILELSSKQKEQFENNEWIDITNIDVPSTQTTKKSKTENKLAESGLKEKMMLLGKENKMDKNEFLWFDENDTNNSNNHTNKKNKKNNYHTNKANKKQKTHIAKIRRARESNNRIAKSYNDNFEKSYEPFKNKKMF